MNLGVLLLLLLAHFVVDFPLQSQKIINLRNNDNWKMSLAGNSLHACVYFVVSLASVIFYLSYNIFFIVVITSLLHGIIDFIKSLAILKKPFRKYSVIVFLCDQAIHLAIITFVFFLIDKNPPVSSLIKNQIDEIVAIFSQSVYGVTFNQKLILVFILLLIGLWGVGVFIRIYFNGIKLKEYAGAINQKIELVMYNKKDGADDGGYIIGILERFFIIISIVLNMPLVIGFILTAKSVARLKKFDDDRFVEIFIIGSFISFISAIIIGYIIKSLNVIPY